MNNFKSQQLSERFAVSVYLPTWVLHLHKRFTDPASCEEHDTRPIREAARHSLTHEAQHIYTDGTFTMQESYTHSKAHTQTIPIVSHRHTAELLHRRCTNYNKNSQIYIKEHNVFMTCFSTHEDTYIAMMQYRKKIKSFKTSQKKTHLCVSEERSFRNMLV